MLLLHISHQIHCKCESFYSVKVHFHFIFLFYMGLDNTDGTNGIEILRYSTHVCFHFNLNIVVRYLIFLLHSANTDAIYRLLPFGKSICGIILCQWKKKTSLARNINIYRANIQKLCSLSLLTIIGTVVRLLMLTFIFSTLRLNNSTTKRIKKQRPKFVTHTAYAI